MAPRLLIVDDDPDGREALAELSQGWGWEVRTAPDGAAARQLVTGWRPDVVLSDLVMPVSDGMELVRALRSDVPDVPVVLLSGQASVPLAVKNALPAWRILPGASLISFSASSTIPTVG